MLYDIKPVKSKQCMFQDIRHGECFLEDGVAYMKIQPTNAGNNAVNVAGGFIHKFNKDTLVDPVLSHLKIERV